MQSEEEEIILSQQGIKQFPLQGAKSNCFRLVLDFNSIDTLPGAAVVDNSYPNLRELLISANSLGKIAVLPQLSRTLNVLDLSYNNLHSTSLSSLSQLTQLRELSLSSNKLTNDSFPDLKLLQSIDILRIAGTNKQ